MNEHPDVTPPGAKYIVGGAEHVSLVGRRYLFQLLRIPPNSNGVQGRLRGFELRDSSEWHVLPMNVNWRSRVFAMLATAWPPATLDRIDSKEGLVITFHDIETPERHFWPGGFDKESIWTARFDEKRQQWSLNRERVIEPNEFGQFKSLL